jgi:hypothetical protein
MRMLIGLLLSGLCGCAAIGCTNVAASNVRIDQPKHYIVVLDKSASRSPDLLRDDQNFVRQLVRRLSFGDKLTLMNMQQVGLAGGTPFQSIVMPERLDRSFDSARDKKALRSKQNGALLTAEGFFKQNDSSRVLHTDIFSTLNLVGEREHDTPTASNTLVILSDMLQSARGIEMDGARSMPRSNWLEEQKHMRTLPSLQNTCVLVVGANSTNVPGAKVYGFWRQYFDAVGTTLNHDNYRFTPPEESASLCG